MKHSQSMQDADSTAMKNEADATNSNSNKPDLIYLDNNGSMQPHDKVMEAMRPYLSNSFGNPSSGHWAADSAKKCVEDARRSVADLIGATPGEIVFTSGGSEANNHALKGVWGMAARKGAHFITSAIEHDAVLRPLRYLKTQGAKVTMLPVGHGGIVDPEDVTKALCDDTVLISVMHANNEIGTIQPIEQIAEIARQAGVLMHTDAAQSVGKIAVNVSELGVDLLSLAGHKFGAPNGIGALYIRTDLRLCPLLHGGGHERGNRAGTESALLTAGIGMAAEIVAGKSSSRVRLLRDYFWDCLVRSFGNKVVLNGHPEKRVPNTLSISFPGQVGADILGQMPHVAATTGSACHAGCVDMSHVLIAMGASLDIGIGTIRFSLSDRNTVDEIDVVVRDLKLAMS